LRQRQGLRAVWITVPGSAYVAIEWLEEDEAERLFEKTLSSDLFMQQSGYAGCHSAKETEDYVRGFFSAGFRQSRTAREILRYVGDSPKIIYVVGMRGGYQCFDSTAGENKVPVIFIDVDGRLEIFVRSPHGMQIEFGTKPQAPSRDDHRALMLRPDMAKSVAPGGARHHLNVARDIPLIVNRVSLDNRIAALHEFGHAKQWLERPHLFDAQVRAVQDYDAESLARTVRSGVRLDRLGKIDLKKREAVLRRFTGAEQVDPRLDATKFFTAINQRILEKRAAQQGAGPSGVASRPAPAAAPGAPPLPGGGAGGPPPPPPLRGGATKPKPRLLSPAEQMAKELEELKKEVLNPVLVEKKAGGNWGRVIEMDNMERHEWPICREIGVPYRLNYRDLDGTTTAEASMTSQILLKARELAKGQP
jgi:hypothetical protein